MTSDCIGILMGVPFTDYVGLHIKIFNVYSQWRQHIAARRPNLNSFDSIQTWWVWIKCIAKINCSQFFDATFHCSLFWICFDTAPWRPPAKADCCPCLALKMTSNEEYFDSDKDAPTEAKKMVSVTWFGRQRRLILMAEGNFDGSMLEADSDGLWREFWY